MNKPHCCAGECPEYKKSIGDCICDHMNWMREISDKGAHIIYGRPLKARITWIDPIKFNGE
jgi:hypothetical protein